MKCEFQGTCLDKKWPLIGAMGEELLGHPSRGPISSLEKLAKVHFALDKTCGEIKRIIIVY